MLAAIQGAGHSGLMPGALIDNIELNVNQAKDFVEKIVRGGGCGGCSACR
jgi:hypothetical protein